MSSELNILALYGLVVLLIILVQVLMALPQLGLEYLLTPRDEERKLSGVAARVERSLNNSIIAMALFAPAVLLLQVQGGFSANTLLAAQVFLVARVIYVPVYWFGVSWLRTGVWMAGFLATAFLYLLAL